MSLDLASRGLCEIGRDKTSRRARSYSGVTLLTLSRSELNGWHARGACVREIDVLALKWASGKVTNRFRVPNYP